MVLSLVRKSSLISSFFANSCDSPLHVLYLYLPDIGYYTLRSGRDIDMQRKDYAFRASHAIIIDGKIDRPSYPSLLHPSCDYAESEPSVTAVPCSKPSTPRKRGPTAIRQTQSRTSPRLRNTIPLSPQITETIKQKTRKESLYYKEHLDIEPLTDVWLDFFKHYLFHVHSV